MFLPRTMVDVKIPVILIISIKFMLNSGSINMMFSYITYLIGRLFMCNPMEDHSAELSDMENDVLKIGNIVDEDERRSFKMALYSKAKSIRS